MNINFRVFLRRIHNKLRVYNKCKIFCIGFNKTGTTSLKEALQEMGIIVGSESDAKVLLDAWLIRDFDPIISYCKGAQAFQDSPFSFPYTYIALDQAFPNSKFILTVRDDAEQWYNSLVRFHSKLWSTNGKQAPTKDDLLNAFNHTKGRPWIVNRALFNTPEDFPYEKNILIKFYNNHIYAAINYFKYRDNDLLVLNVATTNAYQELAHFLEIETDKTTFPWENKTSLI